MQNQGNLPAWCYQWVNHRDRWEHHGWDEYGEGSPWWKFIAAFILAGILGIAW
jgi:hypothetical protein